MVVQGNIRINDNGSEEKAEDGQFPVTDEASERYLEGLRAKYGSTWDGPEDTCNPHNWSSLRKVSTTFIFATTQLVTIMSASMLAAAENQIARDLSVSSSTVQIIFSTFFLGLAFGPFLIAAVSEMNGRKNIWGFSCVWYILWSSISPLGNSTALMIVGRFMAGVGASVGITLVGPVMADMYGKDDRGKSLALASLLTYLGPALGPLVGGIVTDLLKWQWLFWVISIVCTLLLVVGSITIKESYAPELLRKKAAGHQHFSGLNIGQSFKNVSSRFLLNLKRPVLILIRRPVIQLIGLVVAVNFGVYTLMLSTFASLWINRYNESEVVSSLNYFSFAIGMTIAAQAGGRTMDWIYHYLKTHNERQDHGKPEYRVPFMVPGAFLVPVGHFWYAWSAENSASWALVDIGAAIFTLGMSVMNQGLMAYQLDEFGECAASANAASRLLSYIFGFAFPIFAPQLYARLGYGWGNSLLAFVAIGICWPVPLILWIWGEKLRACGKQSIQ